MAETLTLTQMAFRILSHTGEGAALAPYHLDLCAWVVNDAGLSETQLQDFKNLFEQVISGAYQEHYKYLYSIKNMTKDDRGWLYWKDKPVACIEYDNLDREYQSVKHFAIICKMLENRGFTPCFENVTCGIYLTGRFRLDQEVNVLLPSTVSETPKYVKGRIYRILQPRNILTLSKQSEVVYLIEILPCDLIEKPFGVKISESYLLKGYQLAKL